MNAAAASPVRLPAAALDGLVAYVRLDVDEGEHHALLSRIECHLSAGRDLQVDLGGDIDEEQLREWLVEVVEQTATSIADNVTSGFNIAEAADDHAALHAALGVLAEMAVRER